MTAFDDKTTDLTRRRLLAAASAATAVSIAGCGETTDDTGDSTDDSTETGAPTATETTPMAEGTETPTETATPTPELAADCSVSATEVTVGEVLTLDASGSQGATSVAIDIVGDGTTDRIDVDDFVIEYRAQSPGTLSPTVIARNGEETDTVECETVTVSAGGAPTVQCSVSTTEATVGETVTIDASDSQNATAVDIDIDGDGNTEITDENEFVVEYELSMAGNVTPTITARNGEQSDTVECETITVTEPDSPSVACSVSSTNVEVGETVTIDASDSQNAQYVEFDLNGDGEVDIVDEDEFTVDYTFPEVGTYTPTVTAGNATGEDTADCDAITVGETQGTVIEVPPTATYLRTSNDGANDTTPIALSEIGVSPGDRITLTRLGHFARGSAFGSAGFGMHGVFSSSDRLRGSSERHRVPDAIDAGPAMATSSTYYGSEPTNIGEDFGIASNDRSVVSATVDVPEEATHLFVAARDNLYEDNSDDPRYAVRIAKTPNADLTDDIDPDESVRETAESSGEDGDPPAPETDIDRSLDPKATYLHTNGDDAPDARAISLGELGVEPGEEITLVRLGSFGNGGSYGMHAVFSETATLLSADERERVPGAVDAGRDHETSATYWGNEATDIPEDFLVADHDQTFRSVTVTVPDGARYIFVAAKDNLYNDNSDNGFGVGFAL